MALLKVVDQTGVEHELEAQAGLTLMEILRQLDFGVPAICGGMCSCATCHIYVDSVRMNQLPDPMPDERELLAELAQRRNESRLSCQVQFNESLAGLRITIAPDE